MILDDIDRKILMENYDIEIINQIDAVNISNILKYLKENDVYYAKDLLLSSLELFLLDSVVFIEKFEKLKKKLGTDYVNRLGEDTSLIEIMYEN